MMKTGSLNPNFILLLLLMLPAMMIFLSGCDKDEPIVEKPEFRLENAIAVDNEFGVMATLVDSFSEPHYQRDELMTMVWEEALAFNVDFGDGSMFVERVAVEDSMVNVVLRFAGREAYAAYNETVFFVGTLSEAQGIGLRLEQPMFDIDDLNTIVDRDTILATEDAYIIVTDEHHMKAPFVIETFGRILYVSEGFEQWLDGSSVRAEEARGDFVYIVFREARR